MESITRLVDSHCDQRQMLKGIVESFAIRDHSWWGVGGSGERVRAGEQQSKYVESIAISRPSVLTACCKSQTETDSVKTNVISWFQYCALQNYLFHSLHSFIHLFVVTFEF